MAYEVWKQDAVAKVGKKDCVFSIYTGTKKFGSLKISKGGIEWVKPDHSYGKGLDWHELSDMVKKV